VREEECVALAWEPDAEHVLDRVYRVTDLRAHHNALPFTVPASDATLFWRPPGLPLDSGALRAGHFVSVFERNPTFPHARTHLHYN